MAFLLVRAPGSEAGRAPRPPPRSWHRRPPVTNGKFGQDLDQAQEERGVKGSTTLTYVINDSKKTTKSGMIKPTGTQDLTWKNPSKNGGEKTTGASQQNFTISGVVTNAGDLHNATSPNRRLTRGIYGGVKP